MKLYDAAWLIPSVAADRRRVAQYGTYDGRTPGKYFDRCRAYHQPNGTVMIFTRDVGHHSSGWWKSPEYERCWHLSLSFRDPGTQQQAPRDARLTKKWLEAFFGDDRHMVWSEPPYSAAGKSSEVWHYRLFANEAWLPIIPRGEVYSKEFTESGWLSYSDLQERLAKEEAELLERLGNSKGIEIVTAGRSETR